MTDERQRKRSLLRTGVTLGAVAAGVGSVYYAVKNPVVANLITPTASTTQAAVNAAAAAARVPNYKGPGVTIGGGAQSLRQMVERTASGLEGMGFVSLIPKTIRSDVITHLKAEIPGLTNVQLNRAVGQIFPETRGANAIYSWIGAQTNIANNFRLSAAAVPAGELVDEAGRITGKIIDSYKSIESMARQVGGGTGARLVGQARVGAQLIIPGVADIDLPLAFGRRAYMGGRLYEVGDYVRRDVSNVMHFMEAFEKGVAERVTGRTTTREFANILTDVRNQFMSSLPLSNTTEMSIKSPGVTQRGYFDRNRVSNLSARQSLEAVGPMQGNQLKEYLRNHSRPIQGWNAISNDAELRAAILADEFMNLPTSVLKELEVEGQQIIPLVDTTKGVNILKGIVHRPSYSQQQMTGTKFDNPFVTGGRFGRSGHLIDPVTGAAATRWSGVREGMLGSLGVGPPGISKSGQSKLLFGTTSQGLLIADPKVSAMLGFDPYMAGGAWRLSQQQRGVLTHGVHQGYRIKYGGDVPTVNPKVMKAIKEQARRTAIFEAGGIVPTGPLATLGSFDPITGVSKGEQIGVGSFFSNTLDIDMGNEGEKIYTRMQRTRGAYDINSVQINSKTGNIVVQGHLRDRTRSVSLGTGLHGSVAPIRGKGLRFEARAAAEAIGLSGNSRIHFLGGYRDLKDADKLNMMFNDLVFQAPEGQRGAVVDYMNARLSKERMSQKLYNEMIGSGMEQRFGFKPETMLTPEGGLRTMTMKREALAAYGYGEEAIRAFPKEFEVIKTAMAVTMGGEATYATTKGLHTAAFRTGTSRAHERLGIMTSTGLTDIYSQLDPKFLGQRLSPAELRGEMKMAERQLSKLAADPEAGLFARELAGELDVATAGIYRKGMAPEKVMPYLRGEQALAAPALQQLVNARAQAVGQIRSKAEAAISIGATHMNQLKAVNLGWDEMSMLALKGEGFTELYQQMTGRMQRQAGTAGAEFHAFFGQLGFEVGDIGKGFNVKALRTIAGELPTIKIGSEGAQEIGQMAKSLLEAINAPGAEITTEMSALLSGKLSDRLTGLGFQKGQPLGGFLLETGGVSAPVTLKKGSYGKAALEEVRTIRIGAQQPIYIPGINEMVAEAQRITTGSYPTPVFKAKLAVMAEMANWPTESLYGDAYNAAVKTKMQSVGTGLTKLADATTATMSKGGGFREIAGQVLKGEGSIYSQIIELNQLTIPDRLNALDATSRANYRKLVAQGHGPRAIEEMNRKLAATIFISKEEAHQLPAMMYKRVMQGKGYAISARWPVVAPGSIGVSKFAIAESLERGVVANQRGLMAQFAGDTDMDKITAVFQNQLNDKTRGALEKAYKRTLASAQATDEHITKRIAQMSENSFSKKFIDALKASEMQENPKAWARLIEKYGGDTQGMVREVLAARVSTESMTGMITNRARLQFEVLAGMTAAENISASRLSMITAAGDVMGLAVIESPIKMSKALGGPLVGQQIMEMMGAGQTEELAQKLFTIAKIQNIGAIGEEEAAIARQMQRGAGLPGFAWGKVYEDAMTANRGAEGFMDLSRLLIESHGKAGEVERYIKIIRKASQTVGSEDVVKMFGELHRGADDMSIVAKQMLQTFVSEEGMGAIGGFTILGEEMGRAGGGLGKLTRTTGYADRAVGFLDKLAEGRAGKAITEFAGSKSGKMMAGAAAAVVGLYAMSRLFGGSPPPPPPTPLEQDIPGREPSMGENPVYMRDERQYIGPQRHEFRSTIRGSSADQKAMRRIAQRGNFNIRDDSASNMQFRYGMNRAATSNFGY